MALMEELRAIHGSYNKAAKAMGVPWSTVAMITCGSKPMPIAMCLIAARILGRDPLQTIASVEYEHTKGWIQDAWGKVLRDHEAECV
jgi:hypothetical protein